jgi:hydrogenase expression/formation protein HypC
MKVTKIDGAEGLVEAGGLKRKANFTLMEGIKPGDYVLLHAGFVIEKVKPEEAKKTLEILKNL